MPPPVPASLLKAVTFPCRHHCPPSPPPFICGKKHQKPSQHVVPRSDLVRKNTDNPRIINHFIGTGVNSNFITGRSAAVEWWMRSGSGRANLAAGEGWVGSRKWAGGGPFGGSGKVGGDGIQTDVMGSSLHQCRNEEGAVEINGSYKQQQEEKPPRLLTLPTVLTLGRVAAVPLLVSTFHMNGWWATTATTSIFLAAAITDWLDGYIARKMRLGTAFGAFLDPVADKLMVAATLVLLCTRPLEVAIFGEVPWLLTVPSIAIIGREITMSAVREWAASQSSRVLEAVAVNNLGKWKTATQMTALTILLATRDSSLTGQGALVASGVVLLYISAGLALWSLVVYMRKIWKILLK